MSDRIVYVRLVKELSPDTARQGIELAEIFYHWFISLGCQL